MKNTKKKIKKVTAEQLFKLIAKEETPRLKPEVPWRWKDQVPETRMRWKVAALVVNRLLAQ